MRCNFVTISINRFRETERRSVLTNLSTDFIERLGCDSLPRRRIAPGPYGLERTGLREPENPPTRHIGMIGLRTVRSESEARRRELESRRMAEAKVRLRRIEAEIQGRRRQGSERSKGHGGWLVVRWWRRARRRWRRPSEGNVRVLAAASSRSWAQSATRVSVSLARLLLHSAANNALIRHYRLRLPPPCRIRMRFVAIEADSSLSLSGMDSGIADRSSRIIG